VSSALLASGVRRSLAQIRYVSPVLPGEASGLVARVYEQAERDFGLVAPPLVLHSPAPQALAAAWLMLRETLLATGSAAREHKEVVAAAVSVANECPYCVAVHSSAVRGLIGGSVPAQLAAGRIEEIADPVLRDIAAWAASAGRPGATAPVPVPVDSFSQLAGVAVTFHYLNRMVSIYLPDSPLPPLTPKPMGGWVMGMLASAMLAPAPVPGASLDLLPDAPLPAEFSWAAGQPSIAGALARAAATIEMSFPSRSVKSSSTGCAAGMVGRRAWTGAGPRSRRPAWRPPIAQPAASRSSRRSPRTRSPRMTLGRSRAPGARR
jgi:AhpD family alkylhydroperoxidase